MSKLLPSLGMFLLWLEADFGYSHVALVFEITGPATGGAAVAPTVGGAALR